MINAHAKGYRAEAAVVDLLREYVPSCYRPIPGAHDDQGDVIGLPFVVSVKDHARYAIGDWVGDLDGMVTVAGKETGVVWFKRSRRVSPLDWYVLTPGRHFIPFMTAYMEAKR